MSILQQPVKLHRLGYILVWAQAILGGVLLVECWPPLTHGIFAVLTVASLLCVHKGTARATRVIARIIVSLFWVLALLLAVQTADAAVYGFTAEHVAVLQDGVCWFGGLFLCYLSPVATAAMLYHGEYTARYDRLMGCLILPAQIGSAYVSIFTDADIPWTIGGSFLPYVWLALTVAATVTIWMCARALTPAQRAAVDRCREKRGAKRAARLARAKK